MIRFSNFQSSKEEYEEAGFGLIQVSFFYFSPLTHFWWLGGKGFSPHDVYGPDKASLIQTGLKAGAEWGLKKS